MNLQKKYVWCGSALALAGVLAWSGSSLRAGDDDRDGQRPRKVFVIAMENHNWTQPASVTSPQQIFVNPAAPYINSLVDGTSGISGQVAYAVNYVNAMPGVHPSEPNYVWAEAGDALGTIGTDDDPYFPGPAPARCTPDTAVTTDQHLSAFLTKERRTWRSYQEDVNVDLSTNTPLAMSAWTVPLFHQSGSFTTGTNPWNYSRQYNYAPKHNPMVFFTDTNGGCDTTTANQLRTNYPPLQQLALDLQANRVADYNWITPDQFNDQHTRLTAGYGAYVPANDQSAIAQGDNFLARIVPMIMASDAYQDGGIIVLWWDESEGGDAQETLPFIVISKDVHENVGGKPFAGTEQYSHSSFLRTMQELFRVDPAAGYPWLGAASTATDLSALFRHGVVHSR